VGPGKSVFFQDDMRKTVCIPSNC